MASFELPLARQPDYDLFVKELVDTEGMSIEDATQEAAETFVGEYNTASIFMYKSKDEFDEKTKIETRCRTIENASCGKDSYVNASFCIKGLQQLLTGGADQRIVEGTWHILESRELPKALVKLLAVKEEDDDKDDIGEDDDDEDYDADEDKILQTISIVDFYCLLIQAASSVPQYLRNIEALFTLDEEQVEILKGRLDEDIGEARVVAKVVALLSMLVKIPQNKQLFVAASGVDLLELAAKMNKSQTALVGQIQALVAALA
jgi:hypothetical protein